MKKRDVESLDNGESCRFTDEKLSIEALWEHFAQVFRELDLYARPAAKESDAHA